MIGSLIIDMANLVFFLAMLPQIRSAYINRRNLKGLSILFLIVLSMATGMFVAGNFLVGAMVGATLNIISIVTYVIQIYWKVKYK